MKPKVHTWLLPSAVLCLVMMMAPLVGLMETYGRLSHEQYRSFWKLKAIDAPVGIDSTKLIIKCLIVTAVCFTIAAWRTSNEGSK